MMAKILYKGNTNDGFMRGEGKFEIKQGQTELVRQLFFIETIGRICYRSEIKLVTIETTEKFIRNLIRRGHESVIEHSCLTVIFSNVSRGFTHEMVRHRLCAFSQESTRYVDYADSMMDLEKAELTFIYPPHQILPSFNRDDDRTVLDELKSYGVWEIENLYKALRTSGWQPQDARQFLPIGIASKIAVTANFREWRHIMKMRTQKVAHWEIRYVMCDLLKQLKSQIPVIFEDFIFSDKPDNNGYLYTLKRKAG